VGTDTDTDTDTDIDTAIGHRWHWSYIDDIGWISSGEAAAIDPWGDNATEIEPSTTPDEMSSDNPGTAEFDPWADTA
jgi:hypothetical protein